ncbi:MAG TPA: glycoside hydrolase family 28 protein, partial [Pseudonocardiaceae bacterium]
MPEKFDRRTLLRWSSALGGALVLPALGETAAHADSVSAVDLGARRVLARVREPRFRPRFFPVTAFGAVGDGSTDSTTAFRRAIAVCHETGGGHVVVPPGDYATGPIHLLSNVDLHLEQGSTLLFSTDPAAYLPPVFTRWQGIEAMNYSPLIYAYGQHNIAITGEGVLDAQADATHWLDWKPIGDAEFPQLEAMANAGIPVQQRVAAPTFHFRPPFVQPYLCSNVLIEGITIQNTPFWHLNPVLCHGVTVRGVTVNSSGPNSDGCDPECCDGVVITDCSFNCGDDCIAIKSGRNTDGRRVNVPCQNVLIQRSTFANGHGGVTIGSEMTGGVRNLYARDSRADSLTLNQGLRLKTNSARGGFIEQVYVKNIKIEKLADSAILIDFFYGEGAGQGHNPTVKDIHVEDFFVGTAVYPIYAVGYPDDLI